MQDQANDAQGSAPLADAGREVFSGCLINFVVRTEFHRHRDDAIVAGAFALLVAVAADTLADAEDAERTDVIDFGISGLDQRLLSRPKTGLRDQKADLIADANQ